MGHTADGTFCTLPPQTGFFERAGELLLQAVLGLLLGAVPGLILGYVAGLILGLLCGLVLFAFTRAFFFWPEGELQKYREVAGWVCAATTVAPLLAFWVARDFDTDVFVPFPNPAGTIDSGPVDLIFVTVVPMLIAGGAAWRSGRKVADWWAYEASEAKRKGGAQTATNNSTMR